MRTPTCFGIYNTLPCLQQVSGWCVIILVSLSFRSTLIRVCDVDPLAWDERSDECIERVTMEKTKRLINVKSARISGIGV